MSAVFTRSAVSRRPGAHTASGHADGNGVARNDPAARATGTDADADADDRCARAGAAGRI